MNISFRNFSVCDNVKVLKIVDEYIPLSIKQMLFIFSAWQKVIPNLGYSRHWKVASKLSFYLPTKNGKIDFEFMESFVAELEAQRVAELEAQRVAELEAYLTVTGLKDYELTEEEKNALLKLDNVDFREYRIGELFKVESSKKRYDANKIKLSENGYNYVVRTSLNNGIKGKLNEELMYLNDGNTISFGQDTATIYYQETPYFTGDKIKIMHSKANLMNKKNAHFFITSMNKAFSLFSWGASKFNVKTLEEQKIKLPSNNESGVDVNYMEILIRAVQKLVIKDVVCWADKKVESTKQVIEEK